MNKGMKKTVLAMALCGFAASAFAARVDKDAGGSDEMADAGGCTDNALRIATGPKGKGYSLQYADLAKVCGATVPMCEVSSDGGLANLDLMSTKEADLGYAQYDTWEARKGGDENIAALQGVVSLNYNYLHVLVNVNGYTLPALATVAKKKSWTDSVKNVAGFGNDEPVAVGQKVLIQRFSDLKGKRVALVGSAQFMGVQLNRMLSLGIIPVDANSDAEAINMVKNGAVAAAFTVSGWPSGTVKTLKQDSGVTMVPFDMPINAPYVIRPLNYKGIGVYNNNAVASLNVLFSRSFGGDRAAKVAALKSCMAKNLTALKDGPFQPSWNEIKSFDALPADVARFKR